MNGAYDIDTWGLVLALGMVAVAAIVSELMHMGIGRTLMWSACRALVQLCAMGFAIAALTLLADGLIMAMVYRTCFTTDDQYQTPKAR